jgi:hypothetical protein
MASEDEGRNAIAQLNGKEVDGRQLKVNEARPQGDRNGGGGRGGNFGRNRGYGSDYGGRSW